MDNLMAGLSGGAKPCHVTVVPRAPRHCDNELNQIVTMHCTKIRYQRRSTNSLKLTPVASKDIPVAT